MMGHDMWGWGWMWFGWVLWLILIAVIIWAVVRFTSSASGRSHSTPPQESALDILKKRYARGEISREEFEQMKKDLME